MSLEAVETIKTNLLRDFELLNVFLLKYIPQHPDTRWCNFLVLLKEYGVTLPNHLLLSIEKFIIFPDSVHKLRNEKEFLKNTIPPAINRLFQPGKNISLQLTKDFSLKDLSELVDGLKAFHEPLISVLDMLTFFKLNPCIMFDTYLRSKIKQAVEAEKVQEKSTVHSAGILSPFQFSPPSIQDMVQDPTPKSHGGVSITILKSSLESTKDLLIRIMRGEASYVEIIADGKLDLEKLDIEEEFTTLTNFATISSIALPSFEGLSGVRSLL